MRSKSTGPFLVLILLLPLLAGCAPIVSIPAPSAMAVRTQAAATISLPVSSSAMPLSTASATPASPLPTPLPVARLLPGQAIKKLDVLRQPVDCRLPCLNGLTPGISNDWEAQDFFASLGLDDPSLPRDAHGRWSFLAGPDGFWDAHLESIKVSFLPVANSLGTPDKPSPYLSVSWSHGKIKGIGLSFVPYQNWVALPRLVSGLEEAPQVVLSEFGGEGAVYSRFFLTLVYPRNQLHISYVGVERGTPANPQVCVAPDIPINVFISLGADASALEPFCEFCDPSTGRDWGKQLNKNPVELFVLIRDGNFCLPPR